jgi:hypothetical protein
MEAVWLWNQAEDNYEVYVGADDFVVAPTQGFLVKARNNANINIKKSARCSNCTGTFQKQEKTQILLKMTNGDKNRIAKIYYNKDATLGFDNGLDGRTYHGISNPLDIYTYLLSNSTIAGLNSADMKFQVQSLPNSDYKDMIVPLGITAGAGEQITINAEVSNLPTGIKVLLEDKQTNTIVDLTAEDFNKTPQNALNGLGRFYLHTKINANLSAEEFEADSKYINIYNTPENIVNIAGLYGDANVRIFSIEGKEILKTVINSTGLSTIKLPRLSKGIYIVNLDNQKAQLSKKIIIN